MLTVLRSRVAHPKLESLQFSRVKCSLCNQLYYLGPTLSWGELKMGRDQLEISKFSMATTVSRSTTVSMTTAVPMATTGHYDKLLEVWKLMESVPVEPTVETFASRFEAIARSKERDKAAHMMDTLGLMEKKVMPFSRLLKVVTIRGPKCPDLDVNDMFVQKQWVKDSQDVVLKAVNIVRPKFIPVYPPPSLEYTNPLLNHLNNMDDKEIASWPPYVLSGIGRFLYKIILRDIKIDVNIMRPNSSSKHYLPAFYTVYRNQGGPLHEEIKPHPVLSRLYRAACLPQLTFNANDTPSLCPPIPWTSLETGGYIVAKTNLIRLPQQALQQWSRMQTLPKNQMYPCYDSLNQLGSIPWKVNQRVLDTVIKVFNSGGSDKLDIPEPPSLIPYPEKLSNDMSTEEKAELFKKRLIVKRKKAEMYSLWCDALYRLSLANHFKDSIFWLPHNMDFRGRVYPCPPHLNHLGADMPRSLLQFAKGQPLGPKGLDWLKIHAINLTGLKKRNSISDRLEYANEIMDLIIDSAKDPLDGKKWWMESEDPWQTLACCIEISDALDCPDGPENFISHFPVHQDGSCNGLQHYAALGRDSAGAYSVNLAPAPVPQDVYSAVAAIVERIRSEDAANGMEVAQVLEGFVRRKVVKQTVMTTVYGVTKFGARLQIAKQLKDIDDFPKKHVWPASYYLATKTFESLREMFSSTREIQDWFTESARLISMLCGKNVAYLTPLGLPVVQPYVRLPPKTTTNRSKTGGKYVAHRMDSFERPNVMKQKNAFPPNFIHSLDSSHMMLTSLHCEQAGITFVSVHDCFWTHACSIEIMNKICRQQFVALHSQPILADLSKFLFDEFGYNENSLREPLDEKALVAMEKLNNLLRALPHQGDFDLKNVLDSVYFFS
ncbi:unnamed protein product [Nesidiocoris tenuis]|uniref:DNA-directed RNA polymerase n=1 Tax=Nesidiocoris tenuis TaxID=355587 RepID=A0A6H5HD66_9HEMI|nr:unnamed protein product [Nesidiocoris tenuis]